MKGRIKDFICETETLISIFVTCILIYLSYKINIYENLNQYLDAFKNISIYIASGLLAMIGIILTGIALVLGLLDKSFRKLIRESIGENGVNIIIDQFRFITINIGVASVLFFIIYFSLFTNIYINKFIFYFILFIIVFYFLFTLFYTVFLITNCIELFKIKNKQEDYEPDVDKKYIYDCANEIKIEYLIENLMKNSSDTKLKWLTRKNNHKTCEELVSELNHMVDLKDGISLETKKRIKEYIKNYYKQ